MDINLILVTGNWIFFSISHSVMIHCVSGNWTENEISKSQQLVNFQLLNSLLQKFISKFSMT